MGNKIEFMHIDATPDEEYPLRILKAYRQRCSETWSSWAPYNENVEETNPLIIAMNDAQKKRAEVLDKAIALLIGRNSEVTDEI